MYSFGILLQQIIMRAAPYEHSIEEQRVDYVVHAKEVVMEVKKGANPPQRPVVPVSSCPGPLYAMLEQCWDEHAAIRIPFVRIKEMLQKILGKSGENIIEHLITKMDAYSTELERDGRKYDACFQSCNELTIVFYSGRKSENVFDGETALRRTSGGDDAKVTGHANCIETVHTAVLF